MFGDTQLFTQDAEDTSKYVEWTPPGFKDLIPEDIRGNENLADIKDIGGLAKGYIEARGKVPTVPEKAGDYAFEPGEDQKSDADRIGRWKDTFHGLGLTQKQFEGVVNAALSEQAETSKQMADGIVKTREEAETALKTEWGAEYDSKIEGAKEFYKAIVEKMGDAGKSVAQFMDDTKFGDNPDVIRFMSHCRQYIDEDSLEMGSTGRNSGEIPRTDAGNPMLSDYPEMDKKK